VHRTLEALFTALHDSGVQWSLLRLPRDLEFPPGDVDLLVRPGDLAAFSEAARSVGFVGLPGWQEWPAVVFIAFDRSAARFLVLDVTDRVAFGPAGELSTDLAAGVLDRSVRDGKVVTPSPDDAFWLLLLHCLLDKGAVPEHYRDRLLQGAPAAALGGELGTAVDRALAASALSAASLRALAAEGDWAGLAATAGPLREAWRSTLSPGLRIAARRQQLGRLVRRAALVRRRRGLSVALLGTNGAGKSTLAEGIEKAFPLPVSRVYMGLWKNADNDPSVPRQLLDAGLRPFRAWGKYLTARGLQARGDLVVFDRYVYDALRPPRPPLLLAKRAYFWLIARSGGTPDLTVLLDLPGAVAFGRKGEDGVEETEIERLEFLALGEELDLRVVDATQPAQQVRSDVLALIWEACQLRWSGRPLSAAEPRGTAFSGWAPAASGAVAPEPSDAARSA
jgi:thymidylate kinase